MDRAVVLEDARAGLLQELIEDRGQAIRPVFQPIVALRTGTTVAYEALARGPAGTALAMPEAMFGYAACVHRAQELDWACRAAACRHALSARLPRRVPLFVNAEPSSARIRPPPQLLPELEAAARRLSIVVELTERSLTGDTAAVLEAAEAVRRRGMLIALDDVGADPAGLEMMRLLHPEIIKIDRSVVHGCGTPAARAVVAAVRAQACRSGAVIVAEGIETACHLKVARWIGASLGQGWLLGRPGPLPARFAQRDPVFDIEPADPAVACGADTPAG
ncbi:EAL domain-containing protein [Catellatospora sp. NPDC049609]|uniref:EAL domain-containing protein n=1 Tax=Catellatospora sp. NPDC049609 TaxID=3155505 RepID=UPI00341B529B